MYRNTCCFCRGLIVYIPDQRRIQHIYRAKFNIHNYNIIRDTTGLASWQCLAKMFDYLPNYHDNSSTSGVWTSEGIFQCFFSTWIWRWNPYLISNVYNSNLKGYLNFQSVLLAYILLDLFPTFQHFYSMHIWILFTVWPKVVIFFLN